jgi:beta-lactam-binding protein with PASTA domain
VKRLSVLSAVAIVLSIGSGAVGWAIGSSEHSTGRVFVPNVVGTSLSAADGTLSGAGVLFRNVVSVGPPAPPSGYCNQNVVSTETPSAGSRVSNGQEVDLVFGVRAIRC